MCYSDVLHADLVMTQNLDFVIIYLFDRKLLWVVTIYYEFQAVIGLA